MRKAPSKKDKVAAVFRDPGDAEESAASAVPPEQVTYLTEGFHWRDQKLAPFAIDREGAWHLHRSLLGAPPVNQLSTKGEWGQDAARILWYCAHEPKDWLSEPAFELSHGSYLRLTPEARAVNLEIKIAEWASDFFAGAAIAEVVDLALDILASAGKNRAAPVPDGKGKPSGN